MAEILMWARSGPEVGQIQARGGGPMGHVQSLTAVASDCDGSNAQTLLRTAGRYMCFHSSSFSSSDFKYS